MSLTTLEDLSSDVPPSAVFKRHQMQNVPEDYDCSCELRYHTLLRRVLRRFWGGFCGRVPARVRRRVLGRGCAMGLLQRRVLRRVLRRGSEKGVSRRCLERPLSEYDPLGVRPMHMSPKFI